MSAPTFCNEGLILSDQGMGLERRELVCEWLTVPHHFSVVSQPNRFSLAGRNPEFLRAQLVDRCRKRTCEFSIFLSPVTNYQMSN